MTSKTFMMWQIIHGTSRKESGQAAAGHGTVPPAGNSFEINQASSSCQGPHVHFDDCMGTSTTNTLGADIQCGDGACFEFFSLSCFAVYFTMIGATSAVSDPTAGSHGPRPVEHGKVPARDSSRGG